MTTRVALARGPVRPEGQWWAGWYRLDDEERDRLLSELQNQIRGQLPPGTEIQRTFLSCYPRHALLRFIVPSAFGPRESYAFYAPGQLYPLDWTIEAIEEFNRVALEIRGAEQAEAYLRLATWGSAEDGERRFFIDEPDQLNLSLPIPPQSEEVLVQALRPFEAVDSEATDPPDSYRFRTSTLYAGTIRAVDWVVQPGGAIDRFEDPGVRSLEVPVFEDRIESDRYFVLVRETSLSAERFVRLMKLGPVHQARVTEPVVLRNEVFEDAVSLSQVTFEHGLDLEGAGFQKSLALEQCVFEGQLRLRDAHVEGPLNAPGLWFHRTGAHREHGSLRKLTRYGSYLVDMDASGLKVDGSAYLEGLRAPNVVDLSRVQVGGDLRLGGARIGGSPRPASRHPHKSLALRLDASEVKGDLDLSFARSSVYELVPEPDDKALDEELPGFSEALTVVGGTLWARRLHVHGELNMQGLRCEGNVELDSCTIGAGLTPGTPSPTRRTIVLGLLSVTDSDITGRVDIDGLWVGESAFFFSSKVAGSLFGRTTLTGLGRVPPVHVGGTLDLSGLTIDDVDLEAATLGSVRIVTGQFDRISISLGRVPARASLDDEADGRPVQEVPARLGDLALTDVTVHKRLRIRADVDGDLRIANLDCGGDVEFWTDRPGTALEEGERWAEGAPPSPFEQRTRIGGDLECAGLEVGGRLILTNLAAEGRVIFKNCHIAQDLNCQALGADAGSVEGRTRTDCRHLDLELTRCGGDVDLAGLRVTGEAGSVHARQLEVEGRILLVRPLEARVDRNEIERLGRAQRVQATVAGDLDLSVASTAQLVIAGSSVGGVVNLERGRFRRLDVVEPWLFDGHNLSDIQVERWEIAEEHLRAFLDRSRPFARDTYVKIERVLRNKAQDAEADRVYRAMRGRAVREAKREREERRQAGEPGTRAGAAAGPGVGSLEGPAGPNQESFSTRMGSAFSYLLRTTGSRLQGALYGWGTLYWAPLLVLSLILVPVSWTLFSTPDNIVASSELVGATPGATRTSGPDQFGVDWGRSEGFWLMLRYHVPVVPLAAWEDFRPTHSGAVLRLSGGRQASMRLSAESYALTVYLLNWILWPLFLVGLARRVVRETT